MVQEVGTLVLMHLIHVQILDKFRNIAMETIY